MTDFSLHLELDTSGIQAKIVEQRQKQVLVKDECRVLYGDLQDPEENSDLFDAAMDEAANRIDLESCSNAIVFVSPLFVSFRNIDFPFNSEKKIQQTLPFEVETLLPVITEPYISDFHLLDIPGDSTLILSASIPEALVEMVFVTLARYDIKPVMITVSGYAAALWFLKEHEDVSTFAFLHAANSQVTLVLVVKRKPCAVRAFSSTHMSPENIATAVKQTILGFNQRICADISFDVFVSAEENYPDIDRIYDVLDKTFTDQAGQGLHEPGAEARQVKKTILAETSLSGLLLGKKGHYLFNFCKGQYGTSSFLKTYFLNIAASIVLLLSVIALSMVSTGVDNAKLEKKIAVIDSSALSVFKETFPDKQKIYDPYLQMKANVQAALKKSGVKSPVGNEKVVDIMIELSEKIPASTHMEISRFLFNKGRLVLSGLTDNFNNVDKIKNKLESSDLFQTVSISSAAADKKGDMVNFKFIIEI